MDSVYRFHRHFYDITSMFFLFGRGILLDRIEIGDGERVLEVGCGTGKNLLQLSRNYPLTRFYGLDISSEMLRTAGARFDANDLQKVIVLRQGLVESFSAENTFELEEKFDTIFFSYTLSMVPSWKSAVENAYRNLKPGGSLYILDFANGCDYISQFYRFLWLRLEPFKPGSTSEVVDYLRKFSSERSGRLDVSYIWNRYAFIAELRGC